MLRSLILASVAATLAATPAKAQISDFYELRFTGTVTQAGNDVITARNPDGSTTTLTGDQIPQYRYGPGDAMELTFIIDKNQPVFSNPACGNRFAVTFNPGGTPCVAEIGSVRTPFGEVGMGGVGGDSFPRVLGMDVLRDANGNLTVDLPTGSYTMRYVGVNPYFYTSATGTLSGPTSEPCVNAFDCLAGVITGTLTGWSTNIPIAGDFGLVRPGFDVGYDAGTAGTFQVSGQFGGSSGNPTDVPAPGVMVLFALGAGAVVARRRRRLT